MPAAKGSARTPLGPIMFCQSHHYIFSTFKPKLSHHFVILWWRQLVNQRSPWDFFDLHWLSSQLSIKICPFRLHRWGSSLALFQVYPVTQQYLYKTHGVFVCNMFCFFVCAQLCTWLSLPSSSSSWAEFALISGPPPPNPSRRVVNIIARKFLAEI